MLSSVLIQKLIILMFKFLSLQILNINKHETVIIHTVILNKIEHVSQATNEIEYDK